MLLLYYWRNFLIKKGFIDYININLYLKIENMDINNQKYLFSNYGFNFLIIGIPYSESNFNDQVYLMEFILRRNTSYENKIDFCLEISNDEINNIYSIIKKYKNKFNYISVKISDEDTLRKVIDIKEINIIIPCFKKRKLKINQTIARIASDKNIIFGFEITKLLKMKGNNRCKYISMINDIILILRKYNVKFITISNADSVYDFKDLYSIIAISRILGFNDSELSVKYRNYIEKYILNINI